MAERFNLSFMATCSRRSARPTRSCRRNTPSRAVRARISSPIPLKSLTREVTAFSNSNSVKCFRSFSVASELDLIWVAIPHDSFEVAFAADGTTDCHHGCCCKAYTVRTQQDHLDHIFTCFHAPFAQISILWRIPAPTIRDAPGSHRSLPANRHTVRHVFERRLYPRHSTDIDNICSRLGYPHGDHPDTRYNWHLDGDFRLGVHHTQFFDQLRQVFDRI